MTTVIGNVDYIDGYLRYGHFELDLDNEDLEEFKKLINEEKIEYLKENSILIIDDYRINDYGEITDIEYYENK